MFNKLLLTVTLASVSALALAELQVTTVSYDKNVLGVINSTDTTVDLTIDGTAVQLTDSNYVMPCSPILGFPNTAQLTIPAASYDAQVTCPVFVIIEEIE